MTMLTFIKIMRLMGIDILSITIVGLMGIGLNGDGNHLGQKKITFMEHQPKYLHLISLM